MSIREINENTTVPVKVLIGAIAITASIVAGWINLRAEIRAMRSEIRAETWDRGDMADWSAKLKEKNPAVSVPYVTAKPVSE